jgi:biopolymer transport protein ExbD
MRTGWLVCVALICACKGSTKESAEDQGAAKGQSFAEGLKIICDAPMKSDPHFKTNLKNVDAIKLVESIGELAPADRANRLRDAATKAGLTSCAMADIQAMAPLKDVPQVAAAPGASDLGEGDPMLIATSTGIVVNGKAIIGLTNGQPDPVEIQGGAIGIELPRLETFLAAMIQANAKRDPNQPLQLVLGPKLPYKLLIQVSFTAKKAGFTRFGIVVAAGGTTKSIPIVLPDKADLKHPTQPLGMMVALNKGKLVLWSLSGEEGTLKAPKVTATSTADLVKALDEIRTRRWTKAPRSEADNQIIVMANATDSMQTVADVLAVLRATPDGRELFPQILLSSGFE